MDVCTIPAGVPFLPELARMWAGMAGDALHDGLILLPTRRAARQLAAAFLDRAGGRPLMLPRIGAIGGLDEAPLALAGAITLPPAISGMHRLAVLAKLIMGKRDAAGVRLHADRAWLLARDLAGLMDEAERAEIDLLTGLQRAADPAYALHWEQTLEFLAIVTRAWPDYLAEQGLMNPAARQVALLDAQAAEWRRDHPDSPILAVGNTGDIPAVARLLRVIASLPSGAVVLPGLDTSLPDDVWNQLDPVHSQGGLRDLLMHMDVRREEVATVGTSMVPDRDALLRRALLPAPALSAWQCPFTPALDGISRINPSDTQEEAVSIALILRDALQIPDASVALVTPDRALAQRVGAELSRWGVVADDSAGERLGHTAPAVFLSLLAASVAEQLSPVSLLALLKHPFAAAGLPTAELRRRARLLEHVCLRGPRPHPGLAGLRRALDHATAQRRADGHESAQTSDILGDMLDRVERCLAPLLRCVAAVAIAPADLLSALVAAAEALAATDSLAGPERLWAQEDGEALATHLAEVQEALPVLPLDAPSCLPDLLRAIMKDAVVRGRRVTRARGGVAHPRVHIWGLLEARLQSADVMVLAGLNEGVWPPATDPGPWMSRPMRARVGLPSAEAQIGQAAHDFCMVACAAPTIIVSVPRRRDDAPAVPSRWIVRLQAMLGANSGLPQHPAVQWAALLDIPVAGARAVEPPAPRPTVQLRPRLLTITDIATLLHDPYAVYARRILNLRALDPLDQSADFRDYGSVVHAGIDTYLRGVGTAWPPDAAHALAAQLHAALRLAGVRTALIAWWAPRLQRIATWVDRQECVRRARGAPAVLLPEVKGQWTLSRPGGPFTLVGRADRIERSANGTIAILDYKTGTLPNRYAAQDGREPQLLLEGAMVRAGAFGPDAVGPVAELTYWRLSGGHDEGAVLRLFPDAPPESLADVLADNTDAFERLIDTYDDPATSYPARPLAPREYRRDYAQLARVAEWGAAQDDESAEGSEP